MIDVGDANAQMWMGVIIGVIFVMIGTYIFYHRGLLSPLDFKTCGDEDKEKGLLEMMTKVMKKYFIVHSGEFPPSMWDGVANNISSFVKNGGQTTLVAGEVICIASEKNGEEGKPKPSKFLKTIINEKIPMYKEPGHEILSHEGDCHFRVADNKIALFHKHRQKGTKKITLFNKNSYSFRTIFRKDIDEKVKNAELFNLKDAEDEGSLVIELKNMKKGGSRYRYAKKEEIDNFKKYLKNN